MGCPELQTRPLRALRSPGAPPHSAPWRRAGQFSPSLRFRKPGPLRRTFKLETSREATRDTRDRAPPPETRAPGRCWEQRPLPAARSSAPDRLRVQLGGSRVPFSCLCGSRSEPLLIFLETGRPGPFLLQLCPQRALRAWAGCGVNKS